MAPFFVAYALWAGRRVLRVHPGWLAWPVIGAVAGASVYLYIPVAASLDPPLSYNHPVTIDAFLFLVTGEQFRTQYSGLFSPSSVDVLVASLADLARIAVSRATWALPVLGLVGLAVLVVRRPAFGAACWGALIVGIDVWANYLRLEHYLLVPWLLLGIGVGQSLEALAAGLARLIARAAPGRAAASGWLGGLPSTLAAAAGVLLVVGLVAGNLGGADRSRDRTASNYVDAMLGALPKAPRSSRSGWLDAAVARPVRGRTAPGRAGGRRHQHRLRGLGHQGTSDRSADLRAPGVHPAAVRRGPRPDAAGVQARRGHRRTCRAWRRQRELEAAALPRRAAPRPMLVSSSRWRALHPAIAGTA